MIRRAPDVAWVDSGDRVVVVRLDDPGADPLVLAGSAAAVWRAIGEGLPVEALVADLAAAYGVAPDVLEADVRGLLDESDDHGITVADLG